MLEQWESDLGNQLWSAKTVVEAEAIISECKERYGARPIAVGRENNIGTINIASDSGLALVERLTNGIDSLIERLALRTPDTSNLGSPEQAVRALFGVPTGGHGDMTETERRALGENLVIGMHESGNRRRPTIRVTDMGVGQHSSQFGSTILSLNENNKVGQDYTMGTFGQGGSTTLGFSRYVIVCSRRDPDLLEHGQPDSVGFTIIYEEDTDPATSRLPRYVWLVGKDGLPLQLSVEALPDLEHGTRITHIEYDCQGLEGQFTTQMWQFLNNGLFDPVLPFVLEGDRTVTERKARSRVILGNCVRLSNVDRARGEIRIAAEDTHEIMLPPFGSVTATWWVLERPEGSASTSEPVDSYAKADSAVVMTLHGQRQATQRRVWLKDTTKLPFLYKQMIVQIDTNGLNGAGRRQVYASTRERARKSDLSASIFEDVAALIRGDATLKFLNRMAKERRLAETSRVANDRIRQRLSRFVKTKLKDEFRSGKGAPGSGGRANSGGVGTESGQERGKKKRRGGRNGQRDTDDSRFGNVPTFVRFDSKRLRVSQGFATDVWVLIDAKNGYLPKHDADLAVTIVGASEWQIYIKSRSILLGGKSRWRFQTASDTPLGSYQLSTSLTTANGLLTASIPLEVVPPPEPMRGGRGGKEEETGPEIQWITRENWGEDIAGKIFNSQTVGAIATDDESTIIFVNRDFTALARSVARRELTEDAVVTRRDRYLYPVACGLWLQHHENQRRQETEKPDDEYLEGEMRRLAEAVIAAIDPEVELAGTAAEE